MEDPLNCHTRLEAEQQQQQVEGQAPIMHQKEEDYFEILHVKGGGWSLR